MQKLSAIEKVSARYRTQKEKSGSLGEDNATKTGRTPDEENFHAQVGGIRSSRSVCSRIDKIRSSVPDTEVPEPWKKWRNREGQKMR